MDATEALGILAGVLTTVAFLPQVLHTHRTRSARDLSLRMLLLFNLGLALWLAYRLLIASPGIVLANLVTGVLNLYILAMKLRFG